MFGDFGYRLLMLHAMFRMQMIHYVEIPITLGRIVALFSFTADAVATGEVSCYEVIVRLRSFLRYAETISQGYSSAEQQPLACENV